MKGAVFLTTGTHYYCKSRRMIAKSAGAVEYTDYFSATTCVLDKTLKNLMVRFQKCPSFDE